MKNKKKLIVSAFEDLDVNFLYVLLDDKLLYSNVRKELFIQVYRRFVKFIKKNPEYDTQYKAYPATTVIDGKEISGFVFVNGNGICYLKMAFDEINDEYFNLWQCKTLSTDKVDIKRTMVGISFYQDEEVGFIPDENYAMICKKCIDEVKKLKDKRNEEGALSLISIKEWFTTNEDFFVEYVLPYGYSYIKCAEFINYCDLFRRYRTSDAVELLCKNYCLEFYQFPIINKEAIEDWLSKVDNSFPAAKTGFWYNCNFRKGFFKESHVKVFLPDFYFTQNLGKLMYHYKNWVPIKSR